MSVPLGDSWVDDSLREGGDEPALAVRRLAEYEPHGAGKRRDARATVVDIAHRSRQPDLPRAPRHEELHRLLCLLLEVLDGRRPPNQLRDRLGDGAYASMLAAARRGGGRRGTSRRPQRLHISRPAPGAIELCATVTDGRRCRATAARVELRGDRWLCTNFYLL